MSKDITGYVLWQGRSKIDGRPIVAIATLSSDNRKTGDMVQTWILRQDIDPVAAIASGDDVSVCGRCALRKANQGGCYVNVGQAPLGVWRAYRAGRYPMLSVAEHAEVFSGRSVRLGAYGDPLAVPALVWRRVLRHAASWTGYTHQWTWIPGSAEYKPFIQASCDSMPMAHAARSGGWSTFRIRRPGEPLMVAEKPCPAEYGAVQCIGCKRKCDGAAMGQRFTAITVHGVSAGRF